jgi:hypothetical protein
MLQVAEIPESSSDVHGVVVHGATTTLQINIPIGSGKLKIVCADDYCRNHLPCYALVVKDLDGERAKVTPLMDGSIGWQCEPEKGTPSSHWTEEDNADNAEGKAFSSFMIETSEINGPEDELTFRLERRVKFYQSPKIRRAIKCGRVDKGRRLQIRIRPVIDATADEFLSRVMELA